MLSRPVAFDALQEIVSRRFGYSYIMFWYNSEVQICLYTQFVYTQQDKQMLFFLLQTKALQAISDQSDLDQALIIHDKLPISNSFRIVLSSEASASPTPENVCV